MVLAAQFTVFQHDYPYREMDCRELLWRHRIGGREDGPPVLVLPGRRWSPIRCSW